MVPALVVLASLFSLFFILRMAGARRMSLAQRWPAAILAGLGAFLVFRGSIKTALTLAALAVVAWYVGPIFSTRRVRDIPVDPRDAEARQTLGVGSNANEAEIRRAYREKIAQAHPDRGGSHERASRLTAARDRLLRKRS